MLLCVIPTILGTSPQQWSFFLVLSLQMRSSIGILKTELASEFTSISESILTNAKESSSHIEKRELFQLEIWESAIRELIKF